VYLFLRRLAYRLIQVAKPSETREKHLQMLRVLFEWNYRVNPVRLVDKGEEPELDVKPAGRILER
jgi:hypothetical protein